MRILLTGGFGYIGAHVAAQLSSHGFSFDVIDKNFMSPNRDFVRHRAAATWEIDLQDPLFPNLLSGYDVIIHLAAYISVEESTKKPAEYWKNNLGSTFAFDLSTVDHLIFASTGTAFNPTNPYAATKVACERYLHDMRAAGKLNHTIFRFYNVSGLGNGIKPTGQPTHLIRIAALAARGEIPELTVFGSDYDTRDGTAIRDYIHVEDVAASIVNAIKKGPANTEFECLGTGSGSTVLEVIAAMEKATGKKINLKFAGRRAGDDVKTVCPSQYRHISISKTLEDMCLSAYENV
jgi:UDP-glucose 4-epimerase